MPLLIFFLAGSLFFAAGEPTQKENNDNSSYQQTREELFRDVDKTWQEPSSSIPTVASTPPLEAEEDFSRNEILATKLHALIIPKINFEETSLVEAIEFLKQKSCELDPEKKGINILLPPSDQPVVMIAGTSQNSSDTPSTNHPLSEEPMINLKLREIPLDVALQYVAQQANLRVVIEKHAVSLLPLTEKAEAFITKQYHVAPSFFPSKQADRGSLLISATPNDESKIAPHYDAESYFLSQGIEFPAGTCASYSSSYNRLVVRNTPSNIELIDLLVKAASRVIPSQVSIETKFIEVNQDNLHQLGFNWLLGPFEIGNSGIYGSGGGSTNNLNAGAYPFPATGMNPIGSQQVDDHAINQNSVDAVLANGVQGSAGSSTAAPGIFSVAGIYSNPQFQLVLRALHQQKGIDLMAAPQVTTKSGVNAVVKIIDEFTYPTQYLPPQIPQSTTNSSGSSVYQPPPTITPAFPSAWATKNLGVTLEAKPTIAPDGYTINLELHPQIIDFDGFINYGTPINTVGYNASITNMSVAPFSETLTTNTINQPVFSIREVTTSVKVRDGETIVLGGLIREEIQKFHNKVPLLGDLPLAGRLFQSNGERKVKKNLIVFVTTKILDANGQGHSRDSGYR